MKGKNNALTWDQYPVNRQLKRHFVLGMIWYTVTFVPIMIRIATRLEELTLYWLLLIPLAGASWAMWSWRQGVRNVETGQGTNPMNENSNSMRWEQDPENRRHIRNFILGVVWYTVTLIATITLINARFEESILRYFLILIPVPGALWAIWSSIQGVRNMDELAQKIHTEAAMIAALITAALTFTYGFLEMVGMPKMMTLLFLPIMLGLWGILTPIVRKRYE